MELCKVELVVDSKTILVGKLEFKEKLLFTKKLMNIISIKDVKTSISINWQKCHKIEDTFCARFSKNQLPHGFYSNSG